MNTTLLDRPPPDALTEGESERCVATLGEVLHAFEASEESSSDYRDLLLSTSPLAGNADWMLMAGLIRRMDVARDHWLDVSQRYCDSMAQLKRSGPQPAMRRVATS